jgi:hypothetical protein
MDSGCVRAKSLLEHGYQCESGNPKATSQIRERNGGTVTDKSDRSVSDPEGPDDFDFLFGSWRIDNRRLVDPLDESAPWSEFEATSKAYPILRKLGNVQHYDAPDFPGRPGFQGYALRLFDPEARLWRIWWASTAGGGQLDTPVVGGFRGGVGQFDGDDIVDGRAISVRFLWTQITEGSARWEQSFSFDGGKTFIPNWIMLHKRIAGPA